MKNLDSRSHVRGESVYLDDIPLVEGTLFACVFDSPVAHGKLNGINTGAAEISRGVIHVITANSLIGENQIGGIVPDEPLLADGEVHFQGQPIAIVIAAIKGTLIVLFFMHAWTSPRIYWVVIGVGMLWLGILFTLTLSDYLTRFPTM